MSLRVLTDPSLTIILAVSPTGLGHLRVTDALYHGLPKGSAPLLLGAQAPILSAFYRFISLHPLTRRIMELTEMPPLDKTAAYVGRRLFRAQAQTMYKQIKTILNERPVVPQTVLLVATHNILAHQIGQIKEKLARDMGVKILLVEQVTDDSPQAIWYVHDADMIFVPSVYTKEHLLSYAKKAKLPIVPITVAAYPVSPLFAQEMSEHAFADRLSQVDPKEKSPIHVTVPIPGAAVGTAFTTEYIQAMHRESARFVFHVVSRDAPFTKNFIQSMSQLPYVMLHVSRHDRTTVDTYEKVMQEVHISLEVTKPSEQAFKALMTPKQRGGVIILFATPVGGQEYDNLHFLRNHGLMPSIHEHHQLWHMAAKNETLTGSELLTNSHHWRALRLPDDPEKAKHFTMWCLKEGLFAAMMRYKRAQEGDEVQSNGVEQFWTHISALVEKVL